MSDKQPDPSKRRLFTMFTDCETASEIGKELGRLALYINMSDEFLRNMERQEELEAQVEHLKQALARLHADNEAQLKQAKEESERLRQVLEAAKVIEAFARREEQNAQGEQQARAARGLGKRAGALILGVLALVGHYADIIDAIAGSDWIVKLVRANR